jgi:hypothetical protein
VVENQKKTNPPSEVTKPNGGIGVWRQLFSSSLPPATKMYRKNSPHLRFPTYGSLKVDVEKLVMRRRCYSATSELCFGLRSGRYRNYIRARRPS